MADVSIPFIALTLIILIIIGVFIGALLTLAGKKKEQQFSSLALLGMLLVILGIIFGSDRLIGYSFLGVGVIISVFDVVKNLRRKQ